MAGLTVDDTDKADGRDLERNRTKETKEAGEFGGTPNSPRRRRAATSLF